MVAAKVHAGKYPVFVAQGCIDFGVEVVEVDFGILKLEVAGVGQKQIKIRPPSADHEARFLLHQGPLDGQAAAEQAYASLGSISLAVAFFLTHVEHARQPSAVVRGHASLVQRNVSHRVGIKNAKKPKKVRRGIDGCFIK